MDPDGLKALQILGDAELRNSASAVPRYSHSR